MQSLHNTLLDCRRGGSLSRPSSLLQGRARGEGSREAQAEDILAGASSVGEVPAVEKGTGGRGGSRASKLTC